MDFPCDLGVWLDSAVRNVPRGKLIWTGVPRRVHTASVEGVRAASIATVRKQPYMSTPTWTVSIPGFEWDVSGDRGSSTTQALGIKRSPSRAFRSSKEAIRAVEAAYAALLACPMEASS